MIRAWFSLILAIYLIKTRNLDQISALMRKRKLNCRKEWLPSEAELAFQKIDKAKSFFLSRTACLEQSLALFLLATSKGILVTWCVGVRIAPFISHAWIEVKGKPVQELETIEMYKKIIVV
jgi:hypothetical protein